MGPDPVGETLTPGGFGIGVIAGAEHRDEDGGGAHFAGGRVVNRDRVAGVVDEEFLAGAMLVAKHNVLSLEPTAVQAAVPAIAVAVGLVLAVFLPEQLQREVLVGLQLSPDLGVVWVAGLAPVRGWDRGRRQ
jgi:hypothetical protein